MTDTYTGLEYIADGQIHALNDKYAYMLLYTDIAIEFTSQDPVLKYILELFSKRYSEYLQKNGENSIDIKYLEYNPAYDLIYRPAWMLGPLSTKNSISLKFKRLQNDGLEG